MTAASAISIAATAPNITIPLLALTSGRARSVPECCGSCARSGHSVGSGKAFQLLVERNLQTAGALVWSLNRKPGACGGGAIDADVEIAAAGSGAETLIGA